MMYTEPHIIWYDRSLRLWTAYRVDDEGNQISETEYHVNKQQCLENLFEETK